jgi:hypothetical protein
MRFVFDLDETICTNYGTSDYTKSKPSYIMVGIINKLYEKGHYIEIRTARGKSSGKDWRKLTKKQLKDWEIKFHKLSFNKPSADFYIDDKALTPRMFLDKFAWTD